jgi:hypothetical protein
MTISCLTCGALLAHLEDHCFCAEVIIRCPRCRREQWAPREPDDGQAEVVEIVCNECEEE